MSERAWTIFGRRVVVGGEVRGAAVTVRGEKIERVELCEACPAGAEDVGELVIMPGLVDTHVHVNEPGRTEWEGFETAGMAAAAGGVTTIVVMPLNCTPAATNVSALMGEVEAARGKCRVDHGFWGGVVPGNLNDIRPMWEAGALGFKAFMVESGVEDFGGSSIETIRFAAPVLQQLSAPLLVHAEDPEIIENALPASGLASDPSNYSKYLASRPPEAEDEAAGKLFALFGDHPTLRLHIVHIAAKGPSSLLPLARTMGWSMTGETCPHYLFFDAEHIPSGSTVHKCAPPIRESWFRERLWNRFRDGCIDMVVTDHSPCPPSMKCLDTGDFSKAWGGISSLQLGLSATWTGAQKRGFALIDIARWMCENPAKLAGIEGRKGTIAVGRDADMILFDPDREWTVRGENLYHRHKLTPYDGLTLCGVVKRTILRGRTIYDAALANPFPPPEPTGLWIKRTDT